LKDVSTRDDFIDIMQRKVIGIQHYLQDFCFVYTPAQEENYGHVIDENDAARINDAVVYTTIEIDPDLDLTSEGSEVRNYLQHYERILLILSPLNLKWILSMAESWAQMYMVSVVGDKMMMTPSVYRLISRKMWSRRVLQLTRCVSGASSWSSLKAIVLEANEMPQEIESEENEDDEEDKDYDDLQGDDGAVRTIGKKRKHSPINSSPSSGKSRPTESSSLSVTLPADPMSSPSDVTGISSDPGDDESDDSSSALFVSLPADAVSAVSCSLSAVTLPADPVSSPSDVTGISSDPGDDESDDSLDYLLNVLTDQPSEQPRAPNVEQPRTPTEPPTKVLMMGMVGSMDQEPSNPSLGQWGRDNCRLKELQKMNYLVHTIDDKHHPCTSTGQ
jgi:hypothetical protein